MDLESTDGLETPMIIGKPAPFVRTCIDAVDQALRQDHPDSGLSAMQRSWLAFCVTATLVTHAIWPRMSEAVTSGNVVVALIYSATCERQCITQ
jgi:hypothetical protein